jgi:hypothetical protein
MAQCFRCRPIFLHFRLSRDTYFFLKKNNKQQCSTDRIANEKKGDRNILGLFNFRKMACLKS